MALLRETRWSEVTHKAAVVGGVSLADIYAVGLAFAASAHDGPGIDAFPGVSKPLAPPPMTARLASTVKCSRLERGRRQADNFRSCEAPKRKGERAPGCWLLATGETNRKTNINPKIPFGYSGQPLRLRFLHQEPAAGSWGPRIFPRLNFQPILIRPKPIERLPFADAKSAPD